MALTLDKRAQDQIDSMSETDAAKLVNEITTFLSNPKHAICCREEALESGITKRKHVSLPGFSLVIDEQRHSELCVIRSVCINYLTVDYSYYNTTRHHLEHIIGKSTERLLRLAAYYRGTHIGMDHRGKSVLIRIANNIRSKNPHNVTSNRLEKHSMVFRVKIRSKGSKRRAVFLRLGKSW